MRLFKKKNEQEVKTNSAIYVRGKDRTSSLSPDFISELNGKIDSLFNSFVKSSVNVCFVNGQPYNDLKEMQDDFFNKGRLLVSLDHNESPIFDKVSNLKNRAFHDYLHCILDAPFTYEGEKRVYKATCNFIPVKFHKILYSEFVLQTAYTVNHGNFPVQKVVY